MIDPDEFDRNCESIINSQILASKASVTSLDPIDYYKQYNDKNGEEEKLNIENLIVGECYLAFTQLLHSEFR